MKVTIITPVYNGQAFVKDCIESVRRQTYPNIEHVIVNDGSTDETEAIVRSYEGTYNLKVVSQKNGGIARATNAGFAAATGDVFAWLDADNEYHSDAVESAVQAFKNNPSTDVAYGNITLSFDSGARLIEHKPPQTMGLRQALIKTTGAIPLQPAAFFKRGVYEKIGGFNDAYRVACDYDFWLRAMKAGARMTYIDKSLGIYAMVSTGASQSIRGIYRGLNEMRDICKKHRQPLIGAIHMYLKYSKGFAVGIVRGSLQGLSAKSLLKKTARGALRIALSPLVLPDYLKFRTKADSRFPIRLRDFYPQIKDKTVETGFDRHYVYHTSWAARVLAETRPAKHVDVSSSLYFGGIVSAFVPVEFYDYRPADLRLSGFDSKKGDLMALPFPDGSVPSLSCMHTVEHVGLGRYGDPIDPEGDVKAAKELSRVLAKGGSLLFVTPIGEEARIEWNAHRIYAYEQVLALFPDLKLAEFALIPERGDKGGLQRHADPKAVAGERYACGCFRFVKA